MGERSGIAVQPGTPGGPAAYRRRVLAAVEVALAAAAVLLDLLLPALVMLALAGAFLAVRRTRLRAGLRAFGLVRPARWGRLALTVLALSVGWTLVVLALLMPLAEHVTGTRQDVDAFADLEGNLALLLVLLAATWTLAAVGEELAFRGFLLTRAREALPDGAVGLAVAVALSSVLFGLAHTEQGAVGVLLTTCDAVFFCVLRYRYRTLWASVLAHGFNNTIGLTAFFLFGPFTGLW